MATATSRPPDRAPDVSAVAVDGRTARKLENRDRILDAALDLAANGAEIDTEKIAEASGVSVRSVYNHFPTARHLVAGMYERGSEKVRPLLEGLPDASVQFDERVRRWVDVWARVQEEIAPIRWRALIAEDEHPELQPELEALRRRHRAEIKRVFPEASRPQALLAATDSLTWRVLRRHQGLSVAHAKEVLEEMIRKLAT